MDERSPANAIRSTALWNGLIIEVLMMLQWIYLASHGVVTVIGLFGFWIKLEHRLTKIETDVAWLKDSYANAQDD